MAKIELRISGKVDRVTQKGEILVRFFSGNTFDVYGKSGIFILPKHFKYFINHSATKKAGVIVSGNVQSVSIDDAVKYGYSIRKSGEIVINERIADDSVIEERKAAFRVEELSKMIMEQYEDNKPNIPTSEWLANVIERYHHPERFMSREELNKKRTFYELTEDYLTDKQFAYDHTKAFRVLIRTLARYEMYVNKIEKRHFQWDIDKISKSDILDFDKFLADEWQLCQKYPKQYAKILQHYPVEINIRHKTAKIVERGENTRKKLMKKFRAFMNWCYKRDLTNNKPFEKIEIKSEVYGAPIYLTKAERDLIAQADLRTMWSKLDKEAKKEIPESELASLATQRDIMIFHALTGPRVGDLMRLTPANISSNGILEYMASKTAKMDVPPTPRIPLNATALALVKKYKGADKKGRLFPFISAQKYNQAIKKVMMICGITRMVQVKNSTTGETETRRICDVASSHMMRKTFCGLGYKLVKDPNLIGRMSGHVENSRAFRRYRDIGDDDLREVMEKM